MSNVNYLFNEGSLNVPLSWRDESMNVFTFPDETGGNLVINRTPLPAGMEAEEYYQQVLSQFRTNLKEYKEHNHQQISLAQQSAHLLDYQWRTPEGVMYQMSVLQVVGNKLLTFTYTRTEPFAPKQKETLLNVLYSFKPNT